MAIRLSTAAVNGLLLTGSFNALFTAGFIDIYTGTQPATSDTGSGTVGATKLATLYSDNISLGLHFAAAVSSTGVLPKLASETWSGTILANGQAGWFRLRAAGLDTGVADSTTYVRMDGSIATSGADLNLGSLTFTLGAPFIMASASFTMPQHL